MAGIPTATANSILALILKTTTWANIADNASSSPATTITVALHTADPGSSGTQSTSETAYTNYARQTVARVTSGASGWSTPASALSNLIAALSFPAGGVTGSTITHWSIGTGVSNAMIMSGTVTPNITVASGVTPQLTTASTVGLT